MKIQQSSVAVGCLAHRDGCEYVFVPCNIFEYPRNSWISNDRSPIALVSRCLRNYTQTHTVIRQHKENMLEAHSNRRAIRVRRKIVRVKNSNVALTRRLVRWGRMSSSRTQSGQYILYRIHTYRYYYLYRVIHSFMTSNLI